MEYICVLDKNEMITAEIIEIEKQKSISIISTVDVPYCMKRIKCIREVPNLIELLENVRKCTKVYVSVRN